MRVVVAPDSYKGSVSAVGVAAALERGVLRVFPQAEVRKIPIADGGEGTVEALVTATGGQMRQERVRGPLGEVVDACWGILGKDPAGIMCATSRMVVHRKGEPAPRVAACTLIPYDPGFDMGATLAEAAAPVKLNHPHCATFCVLGGAACSR